MELALGLIETRGLVGAIEAADAMLKAANVTLIRKERVTGGLITIEIKGEVAAVKSAVDAGAVAAQRTGELVSQHIIPRPDDQISELVNGIVAENSLSVEKPVQRKQTPRQSKEQEESLFGDDSQKPRNDDEASETLTASDDVSEDEPETINNEKETVEDKEPAEEVVEKETLENPQNIPPVEELENFNVHDLRHLARSIDNFPIFGRDISKANRRELLDHFISILK